MIRPTVMEGRMSVTRKGLSVIDFFLAALVGFFGIAIALMTLERGPWMDEFVTVGWTTPDTSPREFLRLMTAHDIHPILHYGLIYLAQHAGVTDIVLLRSLNILGLPLVLFALVYGLRQQAVNLSQTLVVWMLFTSSPIFLGYFAELRCYFLLYAASIATSVIWYVLMQHIDANRHLSWSVIATWGACLLIFTNLHYFGTMLGGMLTAALLMKLVIRRLWFQALVIGGVSLAAAAPALVLGAFEVYSTPRGLMSWIRTTPITSVRFSVGMVRHAAANNLAAVAGAVVTCLLILKDRSKWIEIRTPLMLLGMIALFFGALSLADAITPLVAYRYLIAGAGAVTFAVAVLAAGSGAPVWLPAAVGVIALFLQANTLYSNFGIDDGGWLPSARALAQLKSECAMTKIFAYPAYNHTNGLNDIAIGLKINPVSYGYYAKNFGFSYEDLRPGSVIAASGPCPSVIWIERLWRGVAANPNADAQQVLQEFQISKIGVAELKRYGSGVLIVVR
jgi:hypothetical protein